MENTKSLRFKTLGMMFVLFAGLAVCTAVLAADPYPTKPVRLIAPDVAGGGQDVVARMIAPKLSERLGKQVIVENIGGGGGIIGTERAAKSEPDGHTLILVAGKHTIQPSLQKLPYEPVKSFNPIARIGSGPYIIVVHPSVPANSVKELIALAKQKPGQLSFGTAGMTTTSHMSAELFRMIADINFKIVHFKGGGPAIIDLLGGHSHAYFGAIGSTISHIKSGKLRLLGTCGVKRSVIMPDVLTLTEAGVPGFEVTNWYGVLAPAGTPGSIIDRLNNELRAIMKSDDVIKTLLTAGIEVDYAGPTEFGMFIDKEIIRWAGVVKNAGITLE